ncbi:lysylphosphatidylglycerol synthase transmembrane domain-containing protein [Kiritimatiellota bacterium B12222]|nr:lysylphosphatidylglycerol synthase transmembrane domain-containing protein [Kiritimatiellota bacterium B12222]
MKKVMAKLFPILRILFVVGLLSFMILKMGQDKIWELLKSVNYSLFALVFVFLSIEAVLRSYNWSILLKCKGVHLPLRKITYAYITGSFFGYFVPSSLGTDVSRFIALSKQTAIRMEDSVVTVVALNITGLIALLLSAGLSASGLAFVMEEKLPFILIGAGSLTGIVAFSLIVYNREKLRTLIQFKGKLQKIVDKIWKMVDAFTVFEKHTPLLIKVFGLSFVIQILATLSVYTISLSLHSEISILYFFLFMPMIAISRLIPISIAGFGAEQGIFVSLFLLVGVDPTESFLISTLLSSAAMLFIVAGGLVYVISETAKFGKPRPPVRPT